MAFIENTIEAESEDVREHFDEFLADFSSENLIDARDDIRKMCWRCKRPVKACWCKHLPEEKIPLSTTIHILQHPYEKSRCLQTAEMLFQAFEEQQCRLYRGKRFPANKYPGLHELASLPTSLLLFPSNDSIELKSYLNRCQDTTDDHQHTDSIATKDYSNNQFLSGPDSNNHNTNNQPNDPNNLPISSRDKNVENPPSHFHQLNNGNFSQRNIKLEKQLDKLCLSSSPTRNNSSSSPSSKLQSPSPTHQPPPPPTHQPPPPPTHQPPPSSTNPIPPSSTTHAYHLFVIDGTWHQAKGIIFCNPFLHSITKVHLEDTGVSRYTIRTQPTDQGLSTVESVSLALMLLEGRPDIYPALMRPLEALCRTQLEHGAVIHHSKQRLELLGLKYPMKDNYKLLPEDDQKKMKKMRRKMNRKMNRLREKRDVICGVINAVGDGFDSANEDSINCANNDYVHKINNSNLI